MGGDGNAELSRQVGEMFCSRPVELQGELHRQVGMELS